MKILAIESSCDETAVAILKGRGDKLQVLSNVVSSQIDIHRQYGGVVPEVAARHHVLNVLPVINEALTKAGLNLKTAPKALSAIAVTAGPGLITSLIIGLESAKALAYAWKLPLVAVNHIEGHVYANWLTNERIKFPAIILTVSGGHNLLVLMTGHLKYKIIGETRDDAAGEAFDKAAKLLGLGYPGGPAIATEAALIKNEELRIKNLGVASPQSIKLPRPMIHSADLDFSFSGLKTALFYQIQKDPSMNSGQVHSKNSEQAKKLRVAEYAHEFQQACVDVLVSKTIKAGKKYHAPTIMLAGGVSANLVLRKNLAEAIKKNLPHAQFHLPKLIYTTDNAAMIASAGYFKFKAGKVANPNKLRANPNWEL